MNAKEIVNQMTEKQKIEFALRCSIDKIEPEIFLNNVANACNGLLTLIEPTLNKINAIGSKYE